MSIESVAGISRVDRFPSFSCFQRSEVFVPPKILRWIQKALHEVLPTIQYSASLTQLSLGPHVYPGIKVLHFGLTGRVWPSQAAWTLTPGSGTYTPGSHWPTRSSRLCPNSGYDYTCGDRLRSHDSARRRSSEPNAIDIAHWLVLGFRSARVFPSRTLRSRMSSRYLL